MATKDHLREAVIGYFDRAGVKYRDTRMPPTADELKQAFHELVQRVIVSDISNVDKSTVLSEVVAELGTRLKVLAAASPVQPYIDDLAGRRRLR